MRPQDIRPYVAPKLEPEPPLEPSEVKVVEIRAEEVVIEMRPWSSPMIGNAIRGSRLPVRGVVHNAKSCSAKIWYAVEPFGYVCGSHVVPTEEAPTTDSVLQVKAGGRLPFSYVMVLIPEGENLPLWASLDALKRNEDPERQLQKGDTVAIEKSAAWGDAKYWVSVDGKVLPQKGTSMMGQGSAWQGVNIADAKELPFGWITPDETEVFEAAPVPGPKPIPIGRILRRTRVRIVEEQGDEKKRWLKIEKITLPPEGTEIPAPRKKTVPLPVVDQGWVAASAVNEVRFLAKPTSVASGVQQWIDVDLGEQVLVMYEGDKPIFATLVSSGRAIPTPMGTYPIWAKVSAITMKNQPYEDKPYFVNKVPWSTFFQWHNAIHGAYWHDRFGVTKSHGCVNVAPLDARRVFEWVMPSLPAGWTGLRPLDLLNSPTVVVRNSHGKRPFRQDRPIGPPDRELEAQRLVEAEQRRLEASQATSDGTPTATVPVTPTPPVPPVSPTAIKQ